MEKLQAQFIFEVLGRPPENVTDALEMLVKKLDTEKGVHVLERKIHPPVQVKDAKDLFTSFAEVVLETDSMATLVGISFAFMPSNVELISPENLEIKNEDINQLLSTLVTRLHNYDAITKKMIEDKHILLKKLFEVAPQMFKKEYAPLVKAEQTLKDAKAEEKAKLKAKKSVSKKKAKKK